MLYTYRIHRDAWVDVQVEAPDEDAAQEAYEKMEESGELNNIFRDEVVQICPEIDKIFEGAPDTGECIYSA